MTRATLPFAGRREVGRATPGAGVAPAGDDAGAGATPGAGVTGAGAAAGTPTGAGRRLLGLPERLTVHKSGGRDRWSAPLADAPDDPVAAVWACLGQVLDPEIPISLPELGLVYGVHFVDGLARVTLTFTATACPCMDFIREDVTDRLELEPWIDRVDIVEVWDPPWTADRITPEGREKLRRLGVSA